MAYVDMTPEDRAQKGRQLADELQHLEEERADQEVAKKAMKSRVETLEAQVSSLKNAVRSGKEWVDDQGSLIEP
jgi:anti-sigma28 factor (negative regulator of flagellin synthesis)